MRIGPENDSENRKKFMDEKVALISGLEILKTEVKNLHGILENKRVLRKILENEMEKKPGEENSGSRRTFKECMKHN